MSASRLVCGNCSNLPREHYVFGKSLSMFLSRVSLESGSRLFEYISRVFVAYSCSVK